MLFHVVPTSVDADIHSVYSRDIVGTTRYNVMASESYTASKARSNRPGWSISFRHPLRTDARGRPGLKIRRGLGTSDVETADKLVTEMNELLADPAWWNTTRRQEAEAKFSKVIVDAFYDEIQAGRTEPSALREQHIRMPDALGDKYTRVLFVGTTGAGKTTLVRQLIGSDPETDRFPSTAPAKTTISDIEAILAEGEFEAAITFFTEFQVQANIEECIADACLAVLDESPTDVIADRLLNHRGSALPAQLCARLLARQRRSRKLGGRPFV
jgi:hypothetical protein